MMKQYYNRASKVLAAHLYGQKLLVVIIYDFDGECQAHHTSITDHGICICAGYGEILLQ